MNKTPDLPRRIGAASIKLLRQIAAELDDQDRVVLPCFIRSITPMYRELEAELTYERREQRIRETIRQLKRRRFIEVRKIGQQMEMALTDKGAALCLLEDIRSVSPEENGRLLLVSFDIPEQEHARRNLLTRRLKYAGFKKMHASLWSTKKDVRNELTHLIKLIGAKKWVRVYEARELTPD